MKYLVHIMRTVHERTTVAVEAENCEAAIIRAGEIYDNGPELGWKSDIYDVEYETEPLPERPR
jgi:hypothetical protein